MADSFVNDTGLGKIWGKIKDALAGKAPLSHTHTKSQITDFPTSMPASDVYAWAKASSKPSYSISEIDGLQSSLDGKANNTAFEIKTFTLDGNSSINKIVPDTNIKVNDKIWYKLVIYNEESASNTYRIDLPTTGYRYIVNGLPHKSGETLAKPATLSANSTISFDYIIERVQ